MLVARVVKPPTVFGSLGGGRYKPFAAVIASLDNVDGSFGCNGFGQSFAYHSPPSIGM
jgi:hypothetical protein